MQSFYLQGFEKPVGPFSGHRDGAQPHGLPQGEGIHGFFPLLEGGTIGRRSALDEGEIGLPGLPTKRAPLSGALFIDGVSRSNAGHVLSASCEKPSVPWPGVQTP